MNTRIKISLKTLKQKNKMLYDRFPESTAYSCCFLILSMAILFFNLVEPLIAGRLAELGEAQLSLKKIAVPGIVWGIVFAARNILEYVQQKLKNTLKLRVFSQVHKKLFHHNLNLSTEQLNQYPPAYLTARQTEDVEDLEGILSYSLIDGLISWLSLALISAVMLYLNVFLGILCILLILGNISMNYVFPLKQLYATHNEKRAVYKNNICEAYLGLQQIKLSNKERYEEQRLSESIDEYFSARKKRDTTDIVRRCGTNVISSLYFPILMIGGACLAALGWMEFGTVLSFLFFYQKINSAVVPAINFIPLFKIGMGALERISELLSLPEEADSDIFLPDTQEQPVPDIQSVCFHQISFSYGDRTILRQIDMEAHRGVLTAVAGKSGAGKSTVAKLLLQLIRPDSGELLINGINSSCYSKKALRQAVSVVTQENFLFHRTIRENLSYSNEKASEEELWKALRRCGLEDTVRHMEKGLDTDAGQLGSRLSGGERQRLCIAREILKDASVYIFDEATSALDAENERAVNEIIRSLSAEKLVIIITHKSSALTEADVVYTLEHGRMSRKAER